MIKEKTSVICDGAVKDQVIAAVEKSKNDKSAGNDKNSRRSYRIMTQYSRTSFKPGYNPKTKGRAMSGSSAHTSQNCVTAPPAVSTPKQQQPSKTTKIPASPTTTSSENGDPTCSTMCLEEDGSSNDGSNDNISKDKGKDATSLERERSLSPKVNRVINVNKIVKSRETIILEDSDDDEETEKEGTLIPVPAVYASSPPASPVAKKTSKKKKSKKAVNKSTTTTDDAAAGGKKKKKIKKKAKATKTPQEDGNETGTERDDKTFTECQDETVTECQDETVTECQDETVTECQDETVASEDPVNKKLPGKLKALEQQTRDDAVKNLPGKLKAQEQEVKEDSVKQRPRKLTPQEQEAKEDPVRQRPGKLKPQEQEAKEDPERFVPGKITVPEYTYMNVEKDAINPGKLSIPDEEEEVEQKSRDLPGKLKLSENPTEDEKLAGAGRLSRSLNDDAADSKNRLGKLKPSETLTGDQKLTGAGRLSRSLNDDATDSKNLPGKLKLSENPKGDQKMTGAGRLGRSLNEEASRDSNLPRKLKRSETPTDDQKLSGAGRLSRLSNEESESNSNLPGKLKRTETPTDDQQLTGADRLSRLANELYASDSNLPGMLKLFEDPNEDQKLTGAILRRSLNKEGAADHSKRIPGLLSSPAPENDESYRVAPGKLKLSENDETDDRKQSLAGKLRLQNKEAENEKLNSQSGKLKLSQSEVEDDFVRGRPGKLKSPQHEEDDATGRSKTGRLNATRGVIDENENRKLSRAEESNNDEARSVPGRFKISETDEDEEKERSFLPGKLRMPESREESMSPTTKRKPGKLNMNAFAVDQQEGADRSGALPGRSLSSQTLKSKNLRNDNSNTVSSTNPGKLGSFENDSEPCSSSKRNVGKLNINAFSFNGKSTKQPPAAFAAKRPSFTNSRRASMSSPDLEDENDNSQSGSVGGRESALTGNLGLSPRKKNVGKLNLNSFNQKGAVQPPAAFVPRRSSCHQPPTQQASVFSAANRRSSATDIVASEKPVKDLASGWKNVRQPSLNVISNSAKEDLTEVAAIREKMDTVAGAKPETIALARLVGDMDKQPIDFVAAAESKLEKLSMKIRVKAAKAKFQQPQQQDKNQSQQPAARSSAQPNNIARNQIADRRNSSPAIAKSAVATGKQVAEAAKVTERKPVLPTVKQETNHVPDDDSRTQDDDEIEIQSLCSIDSASSSSSSTESESDDEEDRKPSFAHKYSLQTPAPKGVNEMSADISVSESGESEGYSMGPNPYGKPMLAKPLLSATEEVAPPTEELSSSSDVEVEEEELVEEVKEPEQSQDEEKQKQEELRKKQEIENEKYYEDLPISPRGRLCVLVVGPLGKLCFEDEIAGNFQKLKKKYIHRDFDEVSALGNSVSSLDYEDDEFSDEE